MIAEIRTSGGDKMIAHYNSLGNQSKDKDTFVQRQPGF